MTRRRTVLKSIIRDQRHKMFWRRNIFSQYFIFFFQKSDTRGVSACCQLLRQLKLIMIRIGMRTVNDPSRRTIREDQKDTCTCIKSSRNYCQRRSISNKSIWLLYGSKGLQIGHRSSDMKGLHYQWWSWRQKRLWEWKDEICSRYHNYDNFDQVVNDDRQKNLYEKNTWRDVSTYRDDIRTA